MIALIRSVAFIRVLLLLGGGVTPTIFWPILVQLWPFLTTFGPFLDHFWADFFKTFFAEKWHFGPGIRAESQNPEIGVAHPHTPAGGGVAAV